MVERMRKTSMYFCALECSNYLEKTMKCIQKPSGEVITNQKEILTSIKDFYQNLLMNKDNTLWEANFNDMFFYNNVTHLSENLSQELEGPLKIIELSNALKGMKNGKTPGISGRIF